MLVDIELGSIQESMNGDYRVLTIKPAYPGSMVCPFPDCAITTHINIFDLDGYWFNRIKRMYDDLKYCCVGCKAACKKLEEDAKSFP